MARGRRIEFPGACYHVFSRGNEKRNIFRDNQDHYRFMRYLDEIRKEHDLVIFAYVLMPNHFHLVVETSESKLSKVMQDFNGMYSRYFNYKHERAGHLYQGRYKAILVQKDSYLLELTRYVHLNPIRARLVERLKDYRWSSYIEYIGLDGWRNISSKNFALSAFGDGGYMSLKKYKKYLAGGKGVDESIFETGNFAGKILGTLDYAKEILEQFGYKSELSKLCAPSAEQILETVAKDFNTSPQAILQGGATEQRNIAISMIRSQTPMKLKEAAAMFGITHTAISKAVNKLEAEAYQNQPLKQRIDRLIHKLVPDPVL